MCHQCNGNVLAVHHQQLDFISKKILVGNTSRMERNLLVANVIRRKDVQRQLWFPPPAHELCSRSCPLIQLTTPLLLNTTSNQDQHFDLSLNLHKTQLQIRTKHFDLSLNLHNISGASILSQTMLDISNPGPTSSSIFCSSHSLTQLQYEMTLFTFSTKAHLSKPISPPTSKALHRLLQVAQVSFHKLNCSIDLKTQRQTWGPQDSCLLPSRQPLSTFKRHISSKNSVVRQCSKTQRGHWLDTIYMSEQFSIVPRAHWLETSYSSLRMHFCRLSLCNAPIKNI